MAKKPQVHSYENNPPHQNKYPRGDSDWDLQTTACPIDSPKVSSNRGNANVAATLNSNFMHPVYDDLDSVGIQNSRTNGKAK